MALSALKLRRFVDINMAAAVIREFIDFFQDFLILNEDNNWPEESTSEEDIRDAYTVAGHVEKYVHKLQQQGVLDEFLDASLKEHQTRSRLFLRGCFVNPSTIILKKIINSKTSIQQVEVGVKLYLEIYSEEMLHISLTNLFVETASKETLIRNLSTELSEGQLVIFQTKVLLTELNICNNPDQVLENLLNNVSQECLEVIVVSLLNEEPKYTNVVHCIEEALEETMSRKKLKDKEFWDHFFLIRDKYFRRICRKYPRLFNLICAALFDLGKVFKEKMSMEYFYIEMSYKDFKYIVQTICEHRDLRSKFIPIAMECSGDPEYWEQFIKKVAF